MLVYQRVWALLTLFLPQTIPPVPPSLPLGLCLRDSGWDSLGLSRNNHKIPVRDAGNKYDLTQSKYEYGSTPGTPLFPLCLCQKEAVVTEVHYPKCILELWIHRHVVHWKRSTPPGWNFCKLSDSPMAAWAFPHPAGWCLRSISFPPGWWL